MRYGDTHDWTSTYPHSDDEAYLPDEVLFPVPC